MVEEGHTHSQHKVEDLDHGQAVGSKEEGSTHCNIAILSTLSTTQAKIDLKMIQNQRNIRFQRGHLHLCINSSITFDLL